MLRKDQRRRGKNRLSGARAMPLYLVIRSEKRLTSTTHSLPYLGAFSATSFISFYGHSLSPTLSCLSSLIYDGSLSLVSLIWFGYHSNFLCHLLLLSVAMSVLLLCGACNVPCGTVRAYKTTYAVINIEPTSVNHSKATHVQVVTSCTAARAKSNGIWTTISVLAQDPNQSLRRPIL
jgi:hypothetical protein